MISQFVSFCPNPELQQILLDRLDTKKCQDFRLSVHFIQQATKRISITQFKIGIRVRISKKDLAFRKGFRPQFTKEVFESAAISSRKPPTDTIKDR